MRALLALALAGGLAACNEPIVPNHNALTTIPRSFTGVQNAINGAFDARPDVNNYLVWMTAMGRDATYFTNSESRFVTELTGKFAIQPDDFIGGTVWDGLFATIKTADTVQTIIQTVVDAGTPLTSAQIEATWGALETQKAATYMLIAETRDTNGVPINEVGMPVPSSNYAPILCNPSVWAQIVAMLDSAYDSLGVAGASQTFPWSFPPGYALVSGNAGSWQSFTAALRAKARIEYAYSSGRPTDTVSVGSPNQAQLDSAITDITANSPLIYTPSAGLTAAEAVPANDAGVFYSYSSESNDVINPVFNFIKGYYAIQDFVNSVDTVNDARFLAKFVNTGAPANSVNDNGQSSNWQYANNILAGTPVPIVRNVELQFLLAEAYLGTAQYANAYTIINNVRTLVGGLAPAPVTTGYVDTRNLLLSEQRVSLAADGTGDRVIALRMYNLEAARLNIWFDTTTTPATNIDLHTTILPIPTTESQPRAGNIACQNSSGLAVPRVASIRKAKTVR